MLQAYTRPVWAMALLILMQLSFHVLFYLALRRLGAEISFQIFLFPAIWLLMLMVETFTYWSCRYKRLNRQYIWWHIGLLTIAFIALPLVRSLWSLYFGASYSVALNRISFYGFWVCIVAAHYFFVGALSQKPEQGPPQNTDDEGEEETEGLLSEFEE